AFGVDVDYAGVAKTELRRQRARDERDVIGETRFEFLAETRNAFRQEHVVDAVFQVGVLAADVQLPERILRHAGKAQDGLVERRVFALGLRIQAVGTDRITRGAEARDDLFA